MKNKHFQPYRSREGVAAFAPNRIWWDFTLLLWTLVQLFSSVKRSSPSLLTVSRVASKRTGRLFCFLNAVEIFRGPALKTKYSSSQLSHVPGLFSVLFYGLLPRQRLDNSWKLPPLTTTRSTAQDKLLIRNYPGRRQETHLRRTAGTFEI